MGASPPPLLVLGAGAWGTALAQHFATLSVQTGGGPVWLWARNPAHAEALERDRENRRYLPGIALAESLRVAPDLSAACRAWRSAQGPSGSVATRLLVLAGPLASLPDIAQQVIDHLGAEPQSGEGLVWLAKGVMLGPASGLPCFATDLLTHLQAWPKAALSGPSFAQEVARGLPSALALASADAGWAKACAERLHGGPMRIYPTDDLSGVQLGGAIKNVLAIAAGVSDGLALGGNARAALLTRGLAEAARLGQAMGARSETFLGLSALGDLILTATGDLSRNRRVGLAMAQGHRLQQILADLGHVAEGVGAAPALAALARQRGVDCPIVQAVDDLLAGRAQAYEACERLMARAIPLAGH